jgi:F0F1-type ATP synthase delta subunit
LDRIGFFAYKLLVDKNLIGGAVIRMGNRQLDVSVAKAIKDLRKSFSNNLYIKDF